MHTHTFMCTSSALSNTLPVTTVNLHSIFYIPKHYIRPKEKEQISVEKLKKYVAFVDLTFKYIPFRVWESMQQL